MKRLSLVLAIALTACDEPIPGQCKQDSDCPSHICYTGFCLLPNAPEPGNKWEAATCGGAFGDKVMANSRSTIVGALSEPTPAVEGGSIEMKNSSTRCIGGFNSALHSK